jgi:hypothetical protein
MSSGGKRKPLCTEVSDDTDLSEEDNLFEASDLVLSLRGAEAIAKTSDVSSNDPIVKLSRSSFSDDVDYESVSSPGE